MDMTDEKFNRIKGLFLVIDRRNERGLTHWVEELGKREIPAVILADALTLDKSGSLIKEISEKGFEVGVSYNEQPFWDEDYETQLEIMSRIKAGLKSCTNKPLRIFGSKYFAYDENTLQIADKLGVDYILARGTKGAGAVIYKPKEHRARIISVSNVPSKELGTGSLCDESLRCRTATPDDLRDILFDLREDRIILVAQTHVSGVKLHWWNVYQEFFDSGKVQWQPVDDFVSEFIVLPNAEIPRNTRTEYRTPQPKIPLEDEVDFPFE